PAYFLLLKDLNFPSSYLPTARKVLEITSINTMQHLLFAVVLAEVAVILALSFKTPIRKLLIMSLDRAKRGRGPVVVQTVSATVCVVLVASVYSMMKIQKRWVEEGAMNPTDEVIMSKHLLESTLMGGFLFLGLMIDRLHHYMRELRMRRKTMEVIKKEGSVLEGEKARASDEVKSLKQEIRAFQEMQKQLAAEIEAKSKEIRTEETSGIALQKQSEGFLIEFNRLSEENQDLRNQLHTVDSRISRSSIKKNT
uniref:Endoplasmic reticulum transmembrane protein n=2 Tax=Brassica oleracea var. oleracea TaxID=109376 RepID=A0A0D3DXV9_BRAOL